LKTPEFNIILLIYIFTNKIDNDMMLSIMRVVWCVRTSRENFIEQFKNTYKITN